MPSARSCWAPSCSPGPPRPALLTFQGKDDGAGPSGPRPNAEAARASWEEAVGTFHLVDFEGLPTGTFTTGPVASGVSLTLTNNDDSLCQGICSVALPTSMGFGFNTTPDAESTYVHVVPAEGSSNDVDVIFTFSSPIDAFGAYLTGTDSGWAGTFSLRFDDGTSQVIPIAENTGPGGILFVGFVEFGASILSIVYHEAGPFTTARDIFGVDDVVYHKVSSVPEPAAWLLLASGVAGLAAWRRRRRAKGPGCAS